MRSDPVSNRLLAFKNGLEKRKSRPAGGVERVPPASKRAQKSPGWSAASYPPTGWPRSTFGDGGLNFRVRDGTGCAPSSMAADQPGPLCRHPGGRHSAQDLVVILAIESQQLGKSSDEKSSAD